MRDIASRWSDMILLFYFGREYNHPPKNKRPTLTNKFFKTFSLQINFKSCGAGGGLLPTPPPPSLSLYLVTLDVSKGVAASYE